MHKYILIPDSFKGTLSARDFCAVAREAIGRADPGAQVLSIPLADGGEGTVEAFLAACGGQRIECPCTGPYGGTAPGFYGLLPDGTAVVELAAAAGLPLARTDLHPAEATTYGVGQLLLHAARHGARRLLLGLGGSATNDGGCGAAAALSAVFKAPITGVVFVLEILMLDITVASIIPLLISAVTATTLMFFLNGFDPVFNLNILHSFELEHLPYYIVLGLICGLMSYYFTQINSKIGQLFARIKSMYRRWIAGGLIIGVLIFLFPPLYGEGYESLADLMHGNVDALFNNSMFFQYRGIGWVVMLYLIATLFFKVVAMSATNGAGGVGGSFAPSLFVGAFTGASLALVCNTLFGWEVSIVSFTLVGMAGVMSGVMKAPLTSIFLIAELSNGYGLFIPLMITACISFAVGYYLDPDSIYTKQLRLNGELLTHNKDQSVFVFLKLDDLMETDFLRIKENFTLGDIVHIISTARRNIFPVIDNFGRLIGVVQLDDLREDMFKHEKYGHPISDYMIPPPDRIMEHEAILSVMEKFEDKHAWMLPVVDKQGRYLGFISKSRILNAYREQLVKIQQ